MHWATKYIGLPWVTRERDCYGLLRIVYRDVFNIDLPEVPIDATDTRQVLDAFKNSPARRLWSPVDTPEEGDVVFLGRRRESHCGIWIEINGGGVLSSYQTTGVIFEPLFRLEQKGHKLGFYKYAG